MILENGEIILEDDERTWLCHVYSYYKRGEDVSHRKVLIELQGQISKDFDPNQISPYLYSGGEMGGGLAELKLGGLYLVNPGSKELIDANKIIDFIKNFILKNPDLISISAHEASNSLELSAERFSFIMGRIDRYGYFWSGASGQIENFGYENFGLKGNSVINEYLTFESIEKNIHNRILYSISNQDYEYNSVYSELSETNDKIIKNKAFIIMQIDSSKPELEDVLYVFKEVFKKFGIDAVRADEIEHQDVITDVILKAIREYEFIVADLSGERPNVYYEVGYAHANGKKPILYRREGSRIHFDLMLHNVPEYKNMGDLRRRLSKRMEAILGRSPAE
jgi:hypothetical protein